MVENNLKAEAEKVRLGYGEVENAVEAAPDLRRKSKELRADSERLKLKSSAVNKAADALSIRVVELGLALDRSASQANLQ